VAPRPAANRSLTSKQRLALTVIATAVLSPAYLKFVSLNPYLLAVHAGCVPLLWVVRPGRGAGSLLAAGFAVAFGAAFGLRGAGPAALSTGELAILAAGYVALLGLISYSLLGTNRRKEWAQESLLAVLGMHAVVLVSRLALDAVSQSLPVVFDRKLYAIDAGYGAQVSFVLGRLLASLPAVRLIAVVGYLGLPFAYLLAFASMRCNRKFRWILLTHFAVLGIAGRFCYGVVPALGPLYQFPGDFPMKTPDLQGLDIQPMTLALGAQRNAMPSLHMAWTLILVWWTRGQRRWLHLTMCGLAAITVLATLGLGEHYLIDLIVGIPLAVMTCGIVSCTFPGRSTPWLSIGVGAGVTSLWLILIRSSDILVHERWILWGLSAISVLLPLRIAPRTRVPND
jgi:hypothetical protein